MVLGKHGPDSCAGGICFNNELLTNPNDLTWYSLQERSPPFFLTTKNPDTAGEGEGQMKPFECSSSMCQERSHCNDEGKLRSLGLTEGFDKVGVFGWEVGNRGWVDSNTSNAELVKLVQCNWRRMLSPIVKSVFLSLNECIQLILFKWAPTKVLCLYCETKDTQLSSVG